MNGYEGLGNVSRETSEALDHYESLIIKWNPSINLVARSTISDLQSRHIQDSAQLFSHIPNTVNKIADLGSGGGLPGLVLAILAKEFAPETQIILVESDARKTAFLRTVIIDLDLNADVINERIEQVEPLEADIVVARALAPLEKLMSYLFLHCCNEGKSLIPKGRKFQEELATASEKWNFQASTKPSTIDAESVILTISDLQPKDETVE